MNSLLQTEKFAEMVKSKRGAKGLRITASEINGISASTLSRIEQGNIPDVETFLKLCKWLEVSPDFFTNTSNSLETTPNKIAAHLRADQNLPKHIAESLITTITLAYSAIENIESLTELSVEK